MAKRGSGEHFWMWTGETEYDGEVLSVKGTGVTARIRRVDRKIPSTGAVGVTVPNDFVERQRHLARRIGFAQAIEERFPKLKVLRTPDLPPGDTGACRALLRFLRSDSVDVSRIAGIYNVGSGSAGVARAIESLGLTGSVGVVSHDFTDEHRALLAANGLAYVLHQDIHYCISTAARVLRALCENVRGALNVVQPRIEILTAENLH